MSKLEMSENQQNEGDDEMSTFTGSGFSDDSGFDSSFDDKKGDKNSKPKRVNLHAMKRDIAEGKTFNNSFTGPYPEDTEHLHLDKGANPQFDFLN